MSPPNSSYCPKCGRRLVARPLGSSGSICPQCDAVPPVDSTEAAGADTAQWQCPPQRPPTGDQTAHTDSPTADVATVMLHDGAPTSAANAPQEGSSIASFAESATQRLGPYRVLRQLRTWDHGTVYLAEHATLHRAVELFVLAESSWFDAKARADLFDRAQAAARVDHPVVGSRVLEAVQAGPVVYVAREWHGGRPLDELRPRTWLQARHEAFFPTQRLALVMTQAAEGLAAIHAAGLLHGRISLALMDCDARTAVHIHGLGWPSSTSAATTDATSSATAAHSAPSALNDIRDLGAAFFEMVTGQAWHTLRRRSDYVNTIRSYNPGVSTALARIIDHCLSDNPARQYTRAEEVVAACRRVEQPSFRRASLARRFMALSVDLPIFALIVVGLVATGSFVLENLTTYWVAFGTFFALESLIGSTIGHKLLQLRLVDYSGQSPSRVWAFLRRLIALGVWALVCTILVSLSSWLWESYLGLVGFDVILLSGALAYLLVWAVYATAWLTPARRPLHDWLMNISWVTPTQIRAITALIHAPADLRSSLSQYLGQTRSTEISTPAASDSHRPNSAQLSQDLLTLTSSISAQPETRSTTIRISTNDGPSTAADSFPEIDGYEIRSILGQGGMGTVYAGWDTTLQRPVAIKVLRSQLLTQTGVARFEREARLAAQLSHPNIARVYGQGTCPDGPYIVMELLVGITLSDLVASSGQLGLSDVWSIAIQATEGLRVASQNGIVHRDVKPANLFLTADGIVKITDFGISKQLDANELVETGNVETPSATDDGLTRAGTVMGTPLYMSPEQMQGEAVDARSDIYSLGLTLVYLLTGRSPALAPGTSWEDLSSTRSVPSFDLIKRPCSIEHRDVLHEMIADAPEQRFSNYDELLDALHATAPAGHLYARWHVRLGSELINLFLINLSISIWSAIAPTYQYRWIFPVLLLAIYTIGIRCYGQTPGQRYWKLKTIRKDGEPVSWWRAIVRTVSLYPHQFIPPELGMSPTLLSIAPVLLWIISGIMIEFDRERRSIPDWVSGTRVVCRVPQRTKRDQRWLRWRT